MCNNRSNQLSVGVIPQPADKPHLKGVGIALMSMSSGERSLLHINWRYAYGQEGNFSFPHVPPQSDMIMDVELLGFELEEDVSPVTCMLRLSMA